MQANNLVSAEAMAKAVQFDPQFEMPVRPRFPQELVAVPLTDGLLIDGTDEHQILRGQATKVLLPRLLPLLDGNRTVEQLAAELSPVPAEHIKGAIALLYTRGVLEDGAADPDPGSSDPRDIDAQTLSFYRRHVDATRVNRSALEAAERLRNSEVLVLAAGRHQVEARELISKQLRKAGVGTVHDAQVAQQPRDYESTDQPGNKLIIMLVEGEDDHETLAELDELCGHLGIPWLRVAVDTRTATADIGPYFERGETACYRCFWKANSKPDATVAADRRARWLQLRLWANLLATEATYLLSRIAPAATGLHVTRYNLADWSARRLRFPKLPGCPNCRPLPTVSFGEIEPAVAYEDAVRFPSRHLMDPKSHQIHYRASNLELAKDGKRYPSAKRISLPARAELVQPKGSTLEHLLAGRAAATERLDLQRLASLLLLSAGIKHVDEQTGRVYRWAATGGNLGSVEMYVAVRDVAGLEPGFYFYQPHEHQLASLSAVQGPAEVEKFIRNAVPCENDDIPGALIIGVGALHRVAHKYGVFAYRVINLDAGVAFGQSHLVGRSLGLSTYQAQRWADDVIADRLDLIDAAEAVTGVLMVSGISEKER